MLAEFLEKLNELTQPEATIMVPRENGVETCIYSPAESAYVSDSFIPHDTAITVSEVESLLALVGAESRESGAVVIFDGNGATFLPGRTTSGVLDPRGEETSSKDVGRVTTQHKYVRRRSPQWRTLESALAVGTKMTHLQFLRTLQSLRPSIENYPAVYSAYQRISLEAGVKATSAPQVMHGDAGSTLNFTVDVKSGKADVKLPAEFVVNIPLTRFGEVQRFAVEVDAEVKQDGGAILFGLIAPEMQLAEEAAVANEVASFRALVAERFEKDRVAVLVNL